jgi:hypothetical protein
MWYRLAYTLVVLLWATTAGVADAEQHRFFPLNGRGEHVRLGSVIQVGPGRLELVSNLVDGRALGDPAWTTTAETHSPHRLKLGSHSCVLSGNCRMKGNVEIWLAYDIEQQRSLVDPFDCLEFVNRQLTHLAYNQEAEMRVVQIRSTLSHLLSDEESHDPCYIAVDERLAVMPKLWLRGKASTESARTIASRVVEGTDLTVTPTRVFTDSGTRLPVAEFSLSGPITLVRTLKKIEIEFGYTAPKIAYSFSKSLKMDWRR